MNAPPRKPGTVTAVGIVNIILGAICSCAALLSVASPMFMGMMQGMMEQTVSEAKARHQQDLSRLKAQRDATGDPGQRAMLDEQIGRMESMSIPDLDKYMATANSTKMKLLSFLGGGISLILQILLIVSGVGLLRMSPWSRGMALFTSAALIVYVVAYSAINTFVIQPEVNRATQELMDQVSAMQGPNAVRMDMSSIMNMFSGIGGIIGLLMLLAWPVTSLFLLNARSVREAFARQRRFA